MCLLMIDASAKQWGSSKGWGIFSAVDAQAVGLSNPCWQETVAEWAGDAGCRQWVACCCPLSSPGLGKCKMTHTAAAYCSNLGY